MRYLFFDIECANCYKNSCKICEFGYILTDENFNIIEKELILIDPNAPFQKFVIDNILNFSKEEYTAAGFLTKYFDKIKALVEHEDQLVFGHSINDDARYLNDESKRYNLPYMNFKFFDLKYIYAAYKDQDSPLGLQKMTKDFGRIPSDNMHTSLYDALETMLNVKQICLNLSLTGEELIERFKDSSGTTHKGVVKTIEGEKAKERQKLKRAARRQIEKNKRKNSSSTTEGEEPIIPSTESIATTIPV